MTREEASTLFRENDKDKDGFISIEEYFGKERRLRERSDKGPTFVTPQIDSFLPLSSLPAHLFLLLLLLLPRVQLAPSRPSMAMALAMMKCSWPTS